MERDRDNRPLATRRCAHCVGMTRRSIPPCSLAARRERTVLAVPRGGCGRGRRPAGASPRVSLSRNRRGFGGPALRPGAAPAAHPRRTRARGLTLGPLLPPPTRPRAKTPALGSSGALRGMAPGLLPAPRPPAAGPFLGRGPGGWSARGSAGEGRGWMGEGLGGNLAVLDSPGAGALAEKRSGSGRRGLGGGKARLRGRRSRGGISLCSIPRAGGVVFRLFRLPSRCRPVLRHRASGVR